MSQSLYSLLRACNRALFFFSPFKPIVMAHPYYLPKVVGHIELSDAPKKHKCICDDCGNELNDSWGDPRVRVVSHYADGSKDERFICPNCEFDTFGDINNGPRSIFDGTPDWMRMI
jgi:hypothetical protein